jgi:uncharacterized protein with NRDE domain
MCLIIFAYNRHPDYRLILAANRDEFYFEERTFDPKIPARVVGTVLERFRVDSSEV